MPKLGTVDPRFVSYNVEMVEVTRPWDRWLAGELLGRIMRRHLIRTALSQGAIIWRGRGPERVARLTYRGRAIDRARNQFRSAALR